MNDTIYREDAIEVVSLSCGPCLARNSDDCEKCSVPKLRELINAIPSADRPQGEWTQNVFRLDIYRYECSNCKAHHMERYDYCPSCGARMKGANNEQMDI